MKTEAIFAVMKTSYAAVKIRPKKKFRLVRDLKALPSELTSQLRASIFTR